jgi:purine-binding chemotaxis protein CheW
MNGYLLVRANGRQYGLPIEEVVEVVDRAAAEPVPGGQRAVRGVVKVRGQMLPVVHLGALLNDRTPPEEETGTMVVTRFSGRRVAFEVDDADAVVRDTPILVPPGSELLWASGVAHYHEALIPILDVELLGERLVMGKGGAT